MEIEINPKQIASAFLSIVMLLSLINSVLLAAYFYFGASDLYGLVDFFDFDIEGNIPTFYSAVAVLVCSGLLALITRANWHRPNGRRNYWLGLSLLFLFLSIDEATAIHEQLSDFMERFMTGEGVLFFLWIIPYGIATVVLGLVYAKFIWALPGPTRTRFILAGFIFIGGAVGVEMLGASAADRYGYDTVAYSALYTLEEMLEMLGIILFMYALLAYLAEEAGGLVVRLSAPSVSD